MLDLRDPQVQLALRIAASAHADQVDKGGAPYILHPVTVASRLPVGLQPAGLLHDVVEDTDITLDDLRTEGVLEPTVFMVDILTQRKGLETYMDYTRRIAAVAKAGPFGVGALRVKLEDLEHNSDVARWPEMPSGMLKRQEKARRMLIDVMAGVTT